MVAETDPIQILATDRGFPDSPDAGDPTCLCSRCLKVIGEEEIPIRAFDDEKKLEYRYHLKCQGIETEML